ncbi:MAG: DNA polymerase III subunit delta [Rhodospirillales bacterium]|nr:DNA polymerase III subunit delta [Rhodospirillales bacterium]
MKIEPRQAERFLRDPGSVRAVLLHGEDEGLIRERAAALARRVLGSLDDPFRYVELAREEAARLAEEMAALSLTGGRRVVRLREATDASAGAVAAALAGPGEALLILEGPGLTGRSKLVTQLTKAPDAAVLGCYAEEGRALEETIGAILGAHRVSAAPEALAFLAHQLGADRAVTRAEVEKLALYAGESGRVGLADAEAVIGEASGLSLDDAIHAAAEGDAATADRALARAMAEGANPVQVVRAALPLFQRLARAALGMRETGQGAAEAVRAIRPPVFFKRERQLVRALERWSAPALEAACTALWETEREIKRTGAPAETLARQRLLGLARQARPPKRKETR